MTSHIEGEEMNDFMTTGCARKFVKRKGNKGVKNA